MLALGCCRGETTPTCPQASFIESVHGILYRLEWGEGELAQRLQRELPVEIAESSPVPVAWQRIVSRLNALASDRVLDEEQRRLEVENLRDALVSSPCVTPSIHKEFHSTLRDL